MKVQGWAFNPNLAIEHDAHVSHKARSIEGKVVLVLGRRSHAGPQRLRIEMTPEEALDIARTLTSLATPF